MSPTRRRFDGLQLRRSRSGLGLGVDYSASRSGTQGQGDGARNDPSAAGAASDHPSARTAQRRRGTRRRAADGDLRQSVTLTVIGVDQPPVVLTGGEASIGSAADDQLVLDAPAVRPRHALVSLDEDGAMLRMAEPQMGVRLNHRPIESLAFLHDGDIIEVGGVSIAVTVACGAAGANGGADRDLQATRVRRVPPRFVLRGVTGSQFGKLIPIYGRLVIGRGSECDLTLEESGLSRRHAIIETLPDGLFLRDLGSANGSYLNGTRVRDSILRPGDQIVLDNARFLVQAIDRLDQPASTAVAAQPTGRSRVFGSVLLLAAIFVAGVVAALWWMP